MGRETLVCVAGFKQIGMSIDSGTCLSGGNVVSETGNGIIHAYDFSLVGEVQVQGWDSSTQTSLTKI